MNHPVLTFFCNWGESINHGIIGVGIFLIVTFIFLFLTVVISNEPSDYDDFKELWQDYKWLRCLAVAAALAGVLMIFYPGCKTWEGLQNTPSDIKECIQMCKETDFNK